MGLPMDAFVDETEHSDISSRSKWEGILLEEVFFWGELDLSQEMHL